MRWWLQRKVDAQIMVSETYYFSKLAIALGVVLFGSAGMWILTVTSATGLPARPSLAFSKPANAAVDAVLRR